MDIDLPNLLSVIDSGADAITRSVIGNRMEEYRTAEEQARAFRDAGYVGEAGDYVLSDCAATGRTPQEAADVILEIASQWRGAQGEIRAKRLLLKEQARTGGDLESIKSEWLAFERAMRGQLGI